MISQCESCWFSEEIGTYMDFYVFLPGSTCKKTSISMSHGQSTSLCQKHMSQPITLILNKSLYFLVVIGNHKLKRKFQICMFDFVKVLFIYIII